MSTLDPKPSWPMYERVWRRAVLFDRMIAALAIPPLAAVLPENGDAYFAARSRCLDCTREPDCRSFLAAAPTHGVPPEYCPNASYFARCRAAQARFRAAVGGTTCAASVPAGQHG